MTHEQREQIAEALAAVRGGIQLAESQLTLTETVVRQLDLEFDEISRRLSRVGL